MDYPRQQLLGQRHGLGCPRCPLYLRDSPGLQHGVRRLRFAPSVGGIRCRLSPVGIVLRHHCHNPVVSPFA